MQDMDREARGLAFELLLNVSVPKFGETSDNWDSSGVSADGRRVAVSDGTSSDLYSGLFARQLVVNFCDASSETGPEAASDWIRKSAIEWQRSVEQIAATATSARGERIRFRIARNDCGAATFVGLELQSRSAHSDAVSWTTSYVGDTMFFHLSAERKLLTAVPRLSSKDFNNYPDCLLSREDSTTVSVKQRKDVGWPGDILIIATDALAKWLMTSYEHGLWHERIDELLSLRPEEFDGWVQRWRDDAEFPLGDDDTTCVVLRLPGTPPRRTDTRPQLRVPAVPIDDVASVQSGNPEIFQPFTPSRATTVFPARTAKSSFGRRSFFTSLMSWPSMARRRVPRLPGVLRADSTTRSNRHRFFPARTSLFAALAIGLLFCVLVILVVSLLA
jgi:hypothetical protein